MEEVNVNENVDKIEEAKKTLKDFVMDNRAYIIVAGVAGVTYIMGMRRGFGVGYVHGYRQNFRDLARSVTKTE